MRRRLGVAPDQKQPISANDIRKMIDTLPSGLLGVRDRALITVGFTAGFRRSELVALDGSDLAFVPEGLELLVRRRKTDGAIRGTCEAPGPWVTGGARCAGRSQLAYSGAAR
jgi:integrase